MIINCRCGRFSRDWHHNWYQKGQNGQGFANMAAERARRGQSWRNMIIFTVGALGLVTVYNIYLW